MKARFIMTKFKLFAAVLVIGFIGLYGFLYVNHKDATAELGDTVSFDYTYIQPPLAEGEEPIEGAPEPGTEQPSYYPASYIIGQDPALDQMIYDQLMGVHVGDTKEITFTDENQIIEGVSSVNATITEVDKCTSAKIESCTLPVEVPVEAPAQ
jgi:hypothetical protein